MLFFCLVSLYPSFTNWLEVTVHRYPVNVTAYAHLKSPAAMGHMLCPRNSTGPWRISGVISHGVGGNVYKIYKPQ